MVKLTESHFDLLNSISSKAKVLTWTRGRDGGWKKILETLARNTSVPLLIRVHQNLSKEEDTNTYLFVSPSI